MTLDRVAGPDRDVVAALHHPRATALPEQTLDRHGDIQIRRRLMSVERREQSGTAASQNQDVSFVTGNGVFGHFRRPSSGSEPIKMRS